MANRFGCFGLVVSSCWRSLSSAGLPRWRWFTLDRRAQTCETVRAASGPPLSARTYTRGARQPVYGRDSPTQNSRSK